MGGLTWGGAQIQHVCWILNPGLSSLHGPLRFVLLKSPTALAEALAKYPLTGRLPPAASYLVLDTSPGLPDQHSIGLGCKIDNQLFNPVCYTVILGIGAAMLSRLARFIDFKKCRGRETASSKWFFLFYCIGENPSRLPAMTLVCEQSSVSCLHSIVFHNVHRKIYLICLINKAYFVIFSVFLMFKVVHTSLSTL